MPKDGRRRDRLVDQGGRADRDDQHAHAHGDPPQHEHRPRYALEARRRVIPNPISTSPSTNPPTGSHGNEGADALAAGKGVVNVTVTSPAPALTPAVSMAPTGP